MISSQNNRANFAFFDRVVHRQSDVSAADIVGIQDASLTYDNQLILSSLFDPFEVVLNLLLNGFGCIDEHGFEDFRRNLISFLKICRIAARANPTVRTKPIIKTKWPHDVFDIRWITELSVCR